MQAAGTYQPASETPAVSSMDDLPDQLLGHILAMAGLKELLPAALLVCKRWQSVLLSTPALWRRLQIDAPDLPTDEEERWAAWEAAVAHLLRQVAGFAADVQLGSRSRREPHWLGSTLRQLQPAAVRDVSILAYQLPASTSALEALCRLTQLTSLQLNCEGARHKETDPIVGLARVLPALPLRSLHLDVRGLPLATADALPQLSSLTDLQIVSRAGPLPLLQQLTRLARLQQLVVQDRGGYRILWGFLPVPADFPALERYSFHSTVFENLKVGDLLMQSGDFTCTSSSSSEQGAATVDAAQGALSVSVASFWPIRARSGHPLLTALVPRGKQLDALNLNLCSFQLPAAPPVMLAAQQWAQLRQLELCDCRGEVNMDGVVLQLLASAPRLAVLKFCSATDPYPESRLRAFPTAIFSHPALVRAEVLSTFAEDWASFRLPPLPDPRLETLSVVGFSRVPPALAAATSLTELRLGSTLYTTFQVGKRGVATLQQLPRLAVLRLPPLSDEDRRRVQRLLRDRPQLRALIGKALRQHQTCCADD